MDFGSSVLDSWYYYNCASGFGFKVQDLGINLVLAFRVQGLGFWV